MKIAILGNQARSMVNFWSVLCKTLQDAGHEVICIVPDTQSPWTQALEQQGLTVCSYPLDRKGINPFSDLRTSVALWRLYKRLDLDALFAFTIKPVIYGCIAARLAGIKHIFATITGLGYTFETESFLKKCLNKLAIFLYGLSIKSVSRVFFQNEDDRNVFTKAGIINAHTPVTMCPGTGVDITHFAPAPVVEEGPVFLLVGRLLEAKGIYEYVDAARMLKSKYPAARFQLLGPPEEGLGSIPLHTIEQWHRAGDIEYLGQTKDVRPYIAAASVMVLPSWREGTPCSIMEGMSMGRPAVVTDAPGCREVVVDACNGVRVPLHDAAALAKGMEFFIQHPEQITQMGAASRQMAVDKFDAQHVAEQILTAMNIGRKKDD